MRFSSSFGLSCNMQFHAGEGDVKRAVRSVGRMLRMWGGGSGAPAPPDLFDAEIVDAEGQVRTGFRFKTTQHMLSSPAPAFLFRSSAWWRAHGLTAWRRTGECYGRTSCRQAA